MREQNVVLRPMLSRQEVADFLGVSVRTVDRLRQTDDRFPPSVAVGSQVRWRHDDIETYAAPEVRE